MASKITTSVRPAGQTLEDLALQISSLAYQCSTLLKATQSEPLTITSDSPSASAARASLPVTLRDQLAEAALDLWSIALGPEERLRRLAIDWSIPASMRYIVHFGIADLVPHHGEVSYSELAAAAKVPEAHLKRIIRLAGTAGVFKESSPACVAHTALSIRLSSAYPELANYAAHCLEFSSLVAARMPEMSEQWNGSEEKTHTAFNVAYNTKEPLFKWLQHEPAHAVRFGKLMGAMRKNPSWDVKHLVDGWEGWALLGEGSKVVDVGGSLGHASVALAERYSGPEFVVQDLEYVVAQAKEANSVPDAMATRVTTMAHDFFTEQPVKDADVYLLRQILHDWADESAVKILEGLVPAMQKPGARILIMDQVVPVPGTLGRSQEREARTVDLVVMSHFNGKQRDLEEWKQVLQAADQRLRISQVVQPTGSHFAIIEVVLGETGEKIAQPAQPIANAMARRDSLADGESLADEKIQTLQAEAAQPAENEASAELAMPILDLSKTDVVSHEPVTSTNTDSNGAEPTTNPVVIPPSREVSTPSSHASLDKLPNTATSGLAMESAATSPYQSVLRSSLPEQSLTQAERAQTHDIQFNNIIDNLPTPIATS